MTPRNERNVLTVFEQETLHIGPSFTAGHYAALQRLAHTQRRAYFELGRDWVRFAQYVGIVQAGGLTIEILPKVDRRPGPEGPLRGLLLSMLHRCRLLRLDSPGAAQLASRPGALLDLYFDFFLGAVERLLSDGLVRDYRRRTQLSPVVKGRLLLQRQLRRHPVNQERSWVESDEYDYDHYFNRLIGAALDEARGLPLPPRLGARLRRLLSHFPITSPVTAEPAFADPIAFNPRTERYRTAVELARLILAGRSYQLQRGPFPALALLFDMNLLFEEYVFRSLAALRRPGLRVRRQVQRPFWGRQSLRPDLLLHLPEGKTVVLDTKWKLLDRPRPGAADLRQLFVYCQYFNATTGVLLYPRVNGLTDLPRTPFHPTHAEPSRYYAQVCFLDLVRDGRLNDRLGEELLETIGYGSGR